MVESLLLDGGEGPGEAVLWVVGRGLLEETVGDLVVELGMKMGVARTGRGFVGVELDGGGDLESRSGGRIAMMERHGKGHTHTYS